MENDKRVNGLYHRSPLCEIVNEVSQLIHISQTKRRVVVHFPADFSSFKYAIILSQKHLKMPEVLCRMAGQTHFNHHPDAGADQTKRDFCAVAGDDPELLQPLVPCQAR